MLPTETPSALPQVTTFAYLSTLNSPTATVVQSMPLNSIKMFGEKHGWAGAVGNNGASRLLHTNDGGKSWQDVTPETNDRLLPPTFLDGVTAWELASRDNVTTSGEQIETLYRTEDGGKTWVSNSTPFTGISVLTFFDPKNGRAVMYVDCGAGTCWVKLFQTNDSGQTWSLMQVSNPYGAENLPLGVIHKLTDDGFVFQNTSTIWFGGNGCCAYPYADLYVSRDNGETWQHLQMPLPDRDPTSGSPDIIQLPVFFTEKDGFFTASYEGKHPTGEEPFYDYVMATYSTHDGGHTWTPNPSLLRGCDTVFSVNFISITEALAYCGKNLAYVSHDGAKTWQVSK